MSRLIGLALIAFAAACGPEAAAAQDWRTVTTSRSLGDESNLRVEVEYGAGQLTVRPEDGAALYRATLRYDANRFEPITSYRDGRLRIGVSGGSSGVVIGRDQRRRRGSTPGRLDLGLGRATPVDLSLKFGAAQAELELGGLRLRRAQVSTGASETTIRFSEPNPERADRLKLEVGAAAFRAYHLGNANTGRIELDGGVGDILLDLTGAWRSDADVEVSMGLGALTLRLPSDVGVRIDRDSFLASFSAPRMQRRDGAYYSDNWNDAERKLRIKVNAALGSIDVQWVDAAEGTL